jgi:phosphatidate cytidylyltransferase
VNSGWADRFLDARNAFNHPVTVVITLSLVLILAITPLVIRLLVRQGKVDEKSTGELFLRYRSWLILTPLIVVPILAGPGWTILTIGILSLLCYREFARATGMFREKLISLFVVIGILGLTLSSLDNWYRMFVAVSPLTVGAIAIVAILRDQPSGYIQRVALGVFALILFGNCLGHLGYLANDPKYRPILLLVFLSVEMNDVFAFIVGKTFGHRKLIPNTSPNKTVAGAIGALVITTLLVVVVGHFVFSDTVLDNPIHLITLGILTSVTGQFGDLMLSSIKRDLGIKDMAATIPGHGGLLDRFDSVLLAGPILFHYINYFVGVGIDRMPNVLTKG